jgi:hypothetical protein
MAELCFRGEPACDGAALLAAVRAVRPSVTCLAETPLALADEGVTVVVNPPSGVRPEEPPDLSQTWAWSDAADVLATTTHTLLVGEVAGDGPAPDRVAFFRDVLRAVIVHTGPIGTWWPAARLALPPDEVDERPLAGFVNVRMFRVEDRPGYVVMDTLGLACLGLPDLQCYFTGLDPRQMARLLYGAAAYLVDGAVIGPGDTVRGLGPGQVWPVMYAAALVEPERDVLDLYPGPDHAGAD